jgi:hypothetical protein
MDIQITSYDLDLLRGNILDVLDPDLAEVVNGAEPRGESVVLHFPSEDAAEAFLDVVAEESNLALGAYPPSSMNFWIAWRTKSTGRV